MCQHSIIRINIYCLIIIKICRGEHLNLWSSLLSLHRFPSSEVDNVQEIISNNTMIFRYQELGHGGLRHQHAKEKYATFLNDNKEISRATSRKCQYNR